MSRIYSNMGDAVFAASLLLYITVHCACACAHVHAYVIDAFYDSGTIKVLRYTTFWLLLFLNSGSSLVLIALILLMKSSECHSCFAIILISYDTWYDFCFIRRPRVCLFITKVLTFSFLVRS